MTAYEMCIANIARKVRSTNHNTAEGVQMPSAFEYSVGIAAGFCKDPKEVVMDIFNFSEDNHNS
ncbi:hypothetical protein FDG95_gp469 [Pectobacterium phage vB_PcaM_CBB]|uniref:Uncharacterized protein n=1 Tax=Pectobacterium phage vB_PcaM_CBB TaxID=2772511 RepID=A0A1L2CVL8_9CAUD|nr:hypothetical protein FDG95_gp469 [Pectobacterium phage vB_PcaM_CBB]AMM44073.1 hypothetical protein CBB_510 [Pectobacterium phage vB_PcaM_CBB]